MWSLDWYHLKIQIKIIKDKLISYLIECFGGEQSRDVVEALFLALVNKPAMRVDGLIDSLFIGKLTLNIVFNGDDSIGSNVQNLKRILAELKHFNSFVQIDESFGQEGGIYPRLNVQNGQISPGIALQQPDGCVFAGQWGRIEGGPSVQRPSRPKFAKFNWSDSSTKVTYDFGIQQVELKLICLL